MNDDLSNVFSLIVLYDLNGGGAERRERERERDRVPDMSRD